MHHLLVHSDGGFGLTPMEFRSLAFEYACELGKDVSFLKEQVSHNFQYHFVSRHPEVKILKPEEISKYRATAPSETAVQLYFETLANLYQKYNITPNRVFNVDETGIQDQPKAEKVFMRTAGLHIQTVAGERGQLTTILAFASANGDQSAPIVIMQGKNVVPTWRTFLPPGWLLMCTDNGYINKYTFMAAGRHFLKHLERRGLLGQHCVLLLDGHTAHSYNCSFSLLMASHNIHVVQFPSHCTHFLQPYDSCILARLKQCWQNCIRIWNRQRCGSKLNKEQFFVPFRRAWGQAMKPQTIQGGFRQVGVWPLDESRVEAKWFEAKKAMGKNAQF